MRSLPGDSRSFSSPQTKCHERLAYRRAVDRSRGAPPVQQQPLRDWIDRDTGHRVVKLTDDPGGSPLYFHDNAFSPDGNTVMIDTPNGIAIVDVAKIGAPDAKVRIAAPGSRGGYFARQSFVLTNLKTGE